MEVILAYLKRLQSHWGLNPMLVFLNIVGIILQNYNYFAKFEDMNAMLKAVSFLVIEKKVYDFVQGKYVVSQWL